MHRVPTRYDYRVIEELVEPESRVLDLGCGDGALLEYLRRDKHVRCMGVERSADNVIACARRGVPVYHGDLLEGLSMLGDNFFDVAILSRTLQETFEPAAVMQEMLRVAAKGIVSVPNFGHWYIRSHLFFVGTMPKSSALPYEWYDTPNIREVTIKDFREFCARLGITIEREMYLSQSNRPLWRPLANIRAALAIFVVSKP